MHNSHRSDNTSSAACLRLHTLTRTRHNPISKHPPTHSTLPLPLPSLGPLPTQSQARLRLTPISPKLLSRQSRVGVQRQAMHRRDDGSNQEPRGQLRLCSSGVGSELGALVVLRVAVICIAGVRLCMILAWIVRIGGTVGSADVGLDGGAWGGAEDLVAAED